MQVSIEELFMRIGESYIRNKFLEIEIQKLKNELKDKESKE